MILKKNVESWPAPVPPWPPTSAPQPARHLARIRTQATQRRRSGLRVNQLSGRSYAVYAVRSGMTASAGMDASPLLTQVGTFGSDASISSSVTNS